MPKAKKVSSRASHSERVRKSKAPPSAKPLAAKTLAAKPLRRTTETESSALLHELRVHQIELEMQNEELRSARTVMEAALARYTELFDFAPIGYATIWADHGIWDINLAGAELLHRERARLRGQRFELVVSPEHHEAFLELVRAAETSGIKQSCELELLRFGAEPVEVRLSATVLLRAEPKILLAFEDISESKRREHKLELTERALREADRRKDEFLATLSHELRNPLAPIRNSVFVLGRAAPGSDAASRAQTVIDRQVTHLTRLIDDLLDVTRIARGKIQLQLAQLELGALLRRTLEDHRSSFDAAGVALESQIDPEPAWVRADPARMVQIISNILTNALKFTPRAGRVVVSLARQRNAGLLRVVDTGAGIPADVLEHVFEAFAQAPQTLDRARGGLGLGLAMVKGLVELHGGSVSIHSAGLGAGTEVTISLPLSAPPLEVEQDSAPPSRGGRRVLVIEDNLDAADTLQVALTLNGHEVKAAHDGQRGLEVATEFKPEVVICDIGLPGMDGYAVARAFRAHAELHGTVLLALSGYAQPEDLQQARDAGFDHHLAKPTRMDMLERLLSESGHPRPEANRPVSVPTPSAELGPAAK